MPPKVKEELQVFNLEKFSIAQLPEFQAKKEEINSVIDLNPIIEITDSTTYEAAKKSRTAVKTLRTGLEKEQADVKRKIKKNILDVVDNEYELLVSDVKKQEASRQEPITVYEAEIEAKRQEKARAEQQRIDNIKKELDDYVAQWKTAFGIMCFETIEQVGSDFLESYTSYDLTVLEEFESFFPKKVEELTNILSYHTTALTEKENARLEKERMEAEAKKFAEEKAEFEAKQKAIEAENKRVQDEIQAEQNRIAAENFKISQENERKSKEIAEAIAKLDADKKQKEQEESNRIAELNAIEVSEPIEPTANVCTLLNDDVSIIMKTPDRYSKITVNTITDTWDSIAEDFKNSGSKSYSKWLKDNYNVPTKIQ